MKKNEGKEQKPEKTGKICNPLKKHPSAESPAPHQFRVCPDKDKYKKKCPPPIDVCQDPTLKDECAVKKKKQTALKIEDDDIVVIPREKPPQCPSKENPCANDNKPILIEKPGPKGYSCNDLDED